MYLLVTNIPEKFHTPELRNFFSEMIEAGAFNCFHFRHRPHRNLMTLLLEKQPDFDKVMSSEKNNLSSTVSRSHESTDDCLIPDQNVDCSTSGPSGSSNDTNENTSNLECLESGQDNDEKQKSTSSHWLFSGLTGLSSLITEKKQKAIKENHVGHSKSWLGRGSFDNRVTELCESNNPRESELSQEARGKGNFSLSNCEKSTDAVSLKETSSTLEGKSDFNIDSADGNCCVCDVKESFASALKKLYHMKYWVNKEGEISSQQCKIFNLNHNIFNEKNEIDKEYLTRRESALQWSSVNDIKKMIEFQPPSIMPQGNVGTPTLHFKELIRACQLPGNIIGKLGLKFPHKKGKKKFGQVPFDYGTSVYPGNVDVKEKSVVFTAAGDLIPASVDFSQRTARSTQPKKLKLSKPRLELEKEVEDGAEVEEWERFQTFHEDVTSQDRIKERLYEKEIELVWEKGGPGLVFYTDAQYWREQEGDFDEQTTDEWDVDMSIYYDKGAGDLDAKNSVAMLESNEFRSGTLTKSAFRRPIKQLDGSHQNKKKDDEGKLKRKGPSAPPEIGRFEAHTRGFGRRLLESQGWTDGVGLGKKGDGLAYALDNDGQRPFDKKGFGYHGEKLEGWGMPSTSASRKSISAKQNQQNQEPTIRISTIFDKPKDVDPPVPHLRTGEPTRLSHRHQDIKFSKASDSSSS
ncbi:G patch domain-containing protein 3-like [Palaemon carinicauda]|uniref:G patch domain-containing protein 3-like n=1 Tax=Palaemon carinicauda TaxID=392227 RepID=UPI0035B60C45